MSIRLQHLREASSFLSSFVGRVGEIVADLTNNRLIMHDGVTAGGWPAAKLSEVITNTRTAVADANYTVLTSDRLIAYTSLSAARTVTLPAASLYPTGTLLTIIDESGFCSAINTITVARSGSDTVDGAPNAMLQMAYGHIALESDGVSKWTIIGLSSFESRGANGSTIQFGLLEQLITCSGPSSVSTIQIPNRAIVFAVSVLVVTAITGASSYNVDATTNSSGGAGTTAGQFGSSLGIAAGSNNSGVIGPTAWYVASTIKLSAQGGSFTGGQVRIAIQYMLCGTPTS
jgi:hypothetical protein